MRSIYVAYEYSTPGRVWGATHGPFDSRIIAKRYDAKLRASIELEAGTPMKGYTSCIVNSPGLKVFKIIILRKDILTEVLNDLGLV